VVRVRSTEELRGHGEDTTPATAEWLAAAGLLTSANHKLMASVGSLHRSRYELRQFRAKQFSVICLENAKLAGGSITAMSRPRRR